MLRQALLQVNLPKLHSGRIDCRDDFLAVFCFKDCISGPAKLNTKQTGLWIFHKIMCISPGQEEHNLWAILSFWSGVHKFTNYNIDWWLVTHGEISACIYRQCGTYHLCGPRACVCISEKSTWACGVSTTWNLQVKRLQCISLFLNFALIWSSIDCKAIIFCLHLYTYSLKGQPGSFFIV